MRGVTQLVSLFGLVFVYILHAASPSDAEKLKESQTKWLKAREACEGNYTYQVRWSSAFGFGHMTTITVKDNKVVERRYEEFGRPMAIKPGENPPAPKPKWIETGKDIGSHQTEGAAPLTMDELYAEATKIVEKDVPDNHVRSLGIDKAGLLVYCFVRDKRIADDAPLKGVRPIQLQLTPKK
ncbi:MAG: hypothetical protein EBV06_08275 [Planctomycetia bacterium]|nr:hypothetical protein [Planctomycetia bacterium]